MVAHGFDGFKQHAGVLSVPVEGPQALGSVFFHPHHRKPVATGQGRGGVLAFRRIDESGVCLGIDMVGPAVGLSVAIGGVQDPFSIRRIGRLVDRLVIAHFCLIPSEVSHAREQVEETLAQNSNLTSYLE